MICKIVYSCDQQPLRNNSSHIHLRQLVEHVKQGIRSAGGVPFEFNTIAICDKIAMWHLGMHYSLLSRKLIAESVDAPAPAVSSVKLKISKKAEEKLLNLFKKDIKPRDIIIIEAFENAVVVDMALSGSTNTVLHLKVVAKEAVVNLPLSVFDDYGKKVPHLCT